MPSSFQKETLDNLETLVRCVSGIADSGNYAVKVNGRMKRNARAKVWNFIKSGRRTIEFSTSFLRAWEENILSTNNVIRTIIHEIAHFKDALKFRRIALKNKGSSLFVGQTYGFQCAMRHTRGYRWHGKRFKKLEQNLVSKVESEYQESLGSL